jgi:transcriptional regulator with XRE-family HTH domain
MLPIAIDGRLSNDYNSPEMSDNIVGDRIRARRDDLNWSLNHLAEVTGFDPGYISHVEKGKRRPKLENLQRFAEALGTTVEWLRGEEVDPGERKDGSGEPPADPVVQAVITDVLALGELNPETLAQLAPIIRATVEKAERDAAEEKRVRRAERRRIEQAGGADRKT